MCCSTVFPGSDRANRRALQPRTPDLRRGDGDNGRELARDLAHRWSVARERGLTTANLLCFFVFLAGDQPML